MPFKILIDEKLKDKSIRNLYDFINSFQSVDWGLFHYGFDLDRMDKEGMPKCGSTPTNYGCIIFPLFYYDGTKFLGYAGSHVARDELMDLKKQLKEEEFVDINSELERDVVRRIASSYPDVVESASIELILPVVVETDEIPQEMEDALRFFKRQSDRMKKLVDFCKNIPPPFLDVEVHQWNLQYADPKEVEEAVKHVGGEGENFSMDYLGDHVISYLEEEPEEKGYVIILRTDQDAKLTIRELEKRLDKALAPIRKCISKKTCFVTLVL